MSGSFFRSSMRRTWQSFGSAGARSIIRIIRSPVATLNSIPEPETRGETFRFPRWCGSPCMYLQWSVGVMMFLPKTVATTEACKIRTLQIGSLRFSSTLKMSATTATWVLLSTLSSDSKMTCMDWQCSDKSKVNRKNTVFSRPGHVSADLYIFAAVFCILPGKESLKLLVMHSEKLKVQPLLWKFVPVIQDGKTHNV